jgi:thiamine transport system substrate-binding protein
MLGAVLVAWSWPARAQESQTVVLVTHDSFSVSESVLEAFEIQSGLEVEILFLGDAGTLVNQAILSKENPQGDVLFGIDNTFLGRALENDLFSPYQSPLAESLPAEFLLDSEFRVTPIDFGDVCLNYDKAYFEQQELILPSDLQDLTDEAYRGLLVVQNPATSSPGLAFLLATIARFGTDGDYTYLDYWEDLVDNEVLVAADWSSAYYGDFTLAGGQRPLVVSYASSPPAEVFFADPPIESAPTAALVAPGMCFRQIEFAGILDGAQNRAGAEQLIDFMLSLPFQEDMPLQMFVFPVQPEAQLPSVFADHAQLAESPATLTQEAINENRDEWIRAWTETALR